MKKLTTLLLLLAAACLAAASNVHWTGRIDPADPHSGEAARLILTAKIDPSWHIYSITQKVQPGPIGTSFDVSKSPAVAKVEAPVEPPPKKLHDPNFGIDVMEFENEVSFAIPIKLAPGVSGIQKVVVTANDQSCNDRMCDRPESVDVPITFAVAGGSPRPDHLALNTGPPPQSANFAGSGSASPTPDKSAAPADQFSKTLRSAQEGGLFSLIVLAFSAGLLALLTPCVFPMIPITVSYFAKSSGGEKKVNYSGAVAYCLGIIGTFTGLGLAMTLIFGASGIQRLATNPYLNLAIAVLFIVLALSLFGVFELRLPSGIVNKASQGSRMGGLVGPILMGLTFSLTSFTCTVPFVGTILLETTKGDWTDPLIGMVAFSTAFSLPFFLLALFPQYLARLPKSGSWMNTVKGFMGFLEIAAAIKFLSNADLVWQMGLLTRSVVLALWAIIGVTAALYLFGLIVQPHGGGKVGWGRAGFGVLSLVATVLFLAGIKGASLGELNPFLPPDPYPGISHASAAGEIAWIPRYQDALVKAKAASQPMFVDFTGVTCTNCRWMEQNMFTRPEVRKLIDGYVPVELYTDRAQAEDRFNAKLQVDLTKSESLPAYAIVSPDGKPLRVFQGSTRDPQEFIRFLAPPSGALVRN